MAVYHTSVSTKAFIVQTVTLFILGCIMLLRAGDYAKGAFCMLATAFLMYMFRALWVFQIVTDDEGITLRLGKLPWQEPTPKHMSWSAIERVRKGKDSWPYSRKPTYDLLGTLSGRGYALPVDGASRE